MHHEEPIDMHPPKEFEGLEGPHSKRPHASSSAPEGAEQSTPPANSSAPAPFPLETFINVNQAPQLNPRDADDTLAPLLPQQGALPSHSRQPRMPSGAPRGCPFSQSNSQKRLPNNQEAAGGNFCNPKCGIQGAPGTLGHTKVCVIKCPKTFPYAQKCIGEGFIYMTKRGPKYCPISFMGRGKVLRVGLGKEQSAFFVLKHLVKVNQDVKVLQKAQGACNFLVQAMLGICSPENLNKHTWWQRS